MRRMADLFRALRYGLIVDWCMLSFELTLRYLDPSSEMSSSEWEKGLRC